MTTATAISPNHAAYLAHSPVRLERLQKAIDDFQARHPSSEYSHDLRVISAKRGVNELFEGPTASQDAAARANELNDIDWPDKGDWRVQTADDLMEIIGFSTWALTDPYTISQLY